MVNRNPVQKMDRMGRVMGSRQLATMLPDLSQSRPAYRFLAQSVRQLILDGRIALHVKLPAERELALALGMSRPTVKAAYDLLREGGYLRSRRGAGTFSALPDSRRPDLLTSLMDATVTAIDLRAASPGMPSQLISDAIAELVPLLATFVPSSGYNPYGLDDLRCAIADRYTARGLPTLPGQILVTSGAQQALSLTLALLAEPGDRVLVENPSYPNALEAIRRARLRPVPVPVTDAGWDMEVAESTIRQTAPRLAYLIPDFHNPTGCLMPAEQRARMVQAASRAGTWLIIDETLADIALDVPPAAPTSSLAARGESEHIITIGSMSKSHWGGLRIGWLRTSSQLVTELADQRVTADMSGPAIDQLLAFSLLTREREMIPARLHELREQRAALAAALDQHMPEWTYHLPAGGLSLWVNVGETMTSALSEHAADYGVRIQSGARFGTDPGTFEHRLRIPYALPAPTLEEAVRRLATALADGLPTTPRRDRPHWVA